MLLIDVIKKDKVTKIESLPFRNFKAYFKRIQKERIFQKNSKTKITQKRTARSHLAFPKVLAKRSLFHQERLLTPSLSYQTATYCEDACNNLKPESLQQKSPDHPCSAP
ncbi:hypothetical protein CEXT_597471 [Caerostris extrusa]|uniref:Uncharacterized protein n=1 Tax=Caerostris extrusa TaxID=172846 RepID=A0AAV4WEL9_CAEEX|nr:hypothetical protein CEXT_597471 [Caerostris extrusa]